MRVQGSCAHAVHRSYWLLGGRVCACCRLGVPPFCKGGGEGNAQHNTRIGLLTRRLSPPAVDAVAEVWEIDEPAPSPGLAAAVAAMVVAVHLACYVSTLSPSVLGTPPPPPPPPLLAPVSTIRYPVP